MRYLLYTQLVLWAWFEPESIPCRILDVFEDRASIKFVSGVSLWEISLDGSSADLIQAKV